MHIEKNVCESIIDTLLGIKEKSKDGLAARMDLKPLNMRSELDPIFENCRTKLLESSFTLSKEDKTRFCKTLSEIKVPDGYSSNIRNRMSMQDLKLYGMKSHDYHVLMQQLLPVAIKALLPDHVKKVIMRVCFFFSMHCAARL